MSQIADTYGNSLYSLSLEEGLADTILAQMEIVRDVIEKEGDFIRLLSAGNLTREERASILDACFGNRVHPYLLNFLKILGEKGYIRQFGACFVAFRASYYDDNGILPVSVVSAIALQEDQIVRLKEKLDGITGKNVQLSCSVDPACLGGIRLDYDGKRIDGTIAARLDALSQQFRNTTL